MSITYTLQRFLAGSLTIACMVSWNLAMENDSLHSDSEEESRSLKRTKVQTWEERAAIAAKTWGESLEKLKGEAERFLQEYRQKYPSEACPASIEGLIVLNKPNIAGLQKEVEEFNRRQEEGQPKTTWEAHLNLNDPTCKFLIPVL